MKTPVQDTVNFGVKEDLILILNKRMINVDIRINHYGNDLEIDIRSENSRSDEIIKNVKS